MPRSLVVLFALISVSCSEAFGAKVLTHIYSVEGPTEDNSYYELLSIEDGEVYRIASENSLALSLARMAAVTHSPVELNVTPLENEIETLSLIDSKNEEESFPFQERKLFWGESFTPTVLSTRREAEQLFNTVFAYDEGYNVDDNCYNRAHYWARYWFVNNKINSQKVFLFFTSKYRSSHNFKWWYHVAPFVLVDSGLTKEEWVLDPTFLDRPVLPHPWSMEFAEGARQCLNGKSMNDYRNNNNKEDCVLIRASMYHYTPTDLESPGRLADWRCSDLKGVMRAIPAPHHKNWSDVKGFLPPGCN